jgi:hypothetical protein
MPSPTRRRSRSRSPRSGTRRSRNLHPIFANDPIVQAMHRGNLLWGNIPMGAPPSPTPSPPSVHKTPNNVFNDYVTPDLRLRKAIWENFPVVLEPISMRDGRELFAVKWHRRNFEEWRGSRATSWEETMEYALFNELRLIHSLRKYPHLYAISGPVGEDEIMRIEMLGKARLARPRSRSPARGAAAAAAAEAPRRARSRSPARGAAAAAAAGPALPVLRKLNDITAHFPGVVVWEKVEGRRGESTYALKVRGDFQRKVDPRIADRVLADLEAALRASRFWTVLRAEGRGEWLRLEMSHT